MRHPTSDLLPFTKYTITDKQALRENLEQTRKRGYAISNRETLLHQIGVAAPIYDEKGNVIAAASIQLNPEDTTDSVIDFKASRLLRTTFEISADMGYQLSLVPPIPKNKTTRGQKMPSK